ncbi:hypothetical protein [Vibrio hyugaensis]|uniref:hypothetical protein n=1 Tax=Vibrio hyugaensis TaxID=1534743 RepID=UPI0005EF77B8|nr:hypothetical protein [Vibrio hyugaensis]
MLTTLLDDSEPSKIRKSIFIFASIIVFAYFHQLTVSAPSALFSSATSSINEIEIGYKNLLLMLALFQIYLLIRLLLSVKIAFAVFNKNWKVDEFKEDEDIASLEKELVEFRKYADEKLSLKSDFDEVINKLNEIVINQESLLLPITSACRISETTASEQLKLTGLLQSQNNIDQITIDQINEVYNFNCNELPIIMSSINSERLEINNLIKSIDNSLSELSVFKDKTNNFNQGFPKSNYNAVIRINQKSLLNSTKFKSLDIMIFELIIPSVVCVASLFICFNPENTIVSSMINFIIGINEP